jgi:5S rRNA maturation endonuclease (ribonuclease M5)
MTKYLEAILEVLKTQTGQLTDRQIHYRLVAKGFYANTRSSYNHLTKVLKDERINGAIPWERIVDSSKPMFLRAQDEREDFSAQDKFENAKETYDSAEETFRDADFYSSFWSGQPEYVEVWVEKDALARILKEITDAYMVSLLVCKGYQSITNEKNRSEYYHNIEHVTQHQIEDLHQDARKVTIIYFGDYDPRGENIPEVIKRDFARLGYTATLDKVALTPAQIEQYHLLAAPCKKSDNMANHWIEQHGDVSYELDALEPNVLRQIVKQNIEAHIDQDALAKRNEYTKQENTKLAELINEYLSGDGD